MHRPAWLRELCKVLTLKTIEGRQQALIAWEARWLVAVHTRTLLSEVELTSAHADLLQTARRHVRYQLGDALAELMGTVYASRPDVMDQRLEVRGEAWAMRLEPKVDVSGM